MWRSGRCALETSSPPLPPRHQPPELEAIIVTSAAVFDGPISLAFLALICLCPVSVNIDADEEKAKYCPAMCIGQ